MCPDSKLPQDWRHETAATLSTALWARAPCSTSPTSHPYNYVIKLGDLTYPGPSAVYFLADEHENSINDSHFYPFSNLKAYQNRWLDAPSGRHGNGTGFAFGDGHAEIHKWLDSNVTPSKMNVFNDVSFLPNVGPRDFGWFTNHIAPWN